MDRQGSESPSLSKSPFGLKSKTFARKKSRESLLSDSECQHTAEKEDASMCVVSGASAMQVAREQVTRCNSAPPDPQSIEIRDSRSHHNLPDASELLSSRSAFVPVKPNKRTNDHEPNLPIMAPVMFVSDLLPNEGPSSPADVLLQPVATRGNRPLSIVQETDEYVDVTPENDSYTNENVEKLLRKSHGTRNSPVKIPQDLRSSPPPLDDTNTSISTLRRLSYVKAQTNSADLPIHAPDLTAQTLDVNSNCDSSSSMSPVFVDDLPSRMFMMEATNETKRVLKEFDQMDPHEISRTVAPKVAEGDLISFDDVNGDMKQTC